MPAYNAALTTTIGVGQQKVLVATGETGITKTIAVAVSREAPGDPQVAVFNTTGQVATLQLCWHDVDADYVPNSTAVTIAAGSTLQIAAIGPFVRFTFSVAPSSGQLVIAR